MSALAILLFATALRFERSLTPGAVGPNRLDVDVALLAGAQPDLRDVRLLDRAGREVGYLLVPPDRAEVEWIEGRVLPVASTKTTSGLEIDLGAARNVDRVRLSGIAAPFLKRATLEGGGDRAHWTLLADATVFDLPEENLRRTEISFPSGDYRYLRVTWDDRSSARVSGGVDAAARLTPFAAQEGALVDMPFSKRASEPGKSRYRIDLPGPHLPLTALAVFVTSGNVYRNATITEPRLGNGEVTPSLLGSGTLRQAQIESLVAAEMEIPIAPPGGSELDLVIDDGNNAPLQITRIAVRLAPQPWIYFEASDASPLRIRYGSETAAAPSYDLEAQRRHLRDRKTAMARMSDAPLTLARTEPPKVTVPLGGAVERSQFRFNRKIQNGAAGLSIVPLDADVLARSPGLADLRIADPEGRQVPYLVERRAEPLTLTLKVPERRADGTASIYRIDLPYERWPSETRLVLTTPLRVFDRVVTLRQVANSHRNRDASVFATSQWRSADPELLPPPLSFDLPADCGAVEVVIDEGDNAPLPLASAQLVLPSYALRFHHPGSALTLLYGNGRVGRPRYDLALLAPRLFAEPAHELSLAAAGAPAGEDDEEAPARKFFWIAIGVAVLVLLALLGKLLRS